MLRRPVALMQYTRQLTKRAKTSQRNPTNTSTHTHTHTRRKGEDTGNDCKKRRVVVSNGKEIGKETPEKISVSVRLLWKVHTQRPQKTCHSKRFPGKKDFNQNFLAYSLRPIRETTGARWNHSLVAVIQPKGGQNMKTLQQVWFWHVKRQRRKSS